MSINWLNALREKHRLRTRKTRRARKSRSLRFEPLEQRALLATLTVNSLQDTTAADDFLTLREALSVADSDSSAGLSSQELAQVSGALGVDTIEFSSDLFAGGGQTLALDEGQLSIASELTIAGPGADMLTIDAQRNSRVFRVSSSADAGVSGLTIANGQVADDGGGILNEGTLGLTNAIVRNNAVSGNSISDEGGGIHNSGTLTIVGSTISNNISGTRSDGGGLQNTSTGTLVIRESTISGNTAGDDGGAIENYGSLTIVDSTLSGNTAGSGSSNNGGAIKQSDGSLTIINSTISGNAGSLGGALYVTNLSDAVTVRNSTLTGNTSRTDGAGVVVRDVSVAFHNTILAGNTTEAGVANDVRLIDTGAFSADSSNNLIGIGNEILAGLTHGVNGNIVGDGSGGDLDVTTILETTLADNSGSTQTHDLVVGSPAIDAGADAEAVDENGTALTLDQRQSARVHDGDGDGTAAVDIGAVEYRAVYVVDTLVDESDGDFSAGDLSLREAIELANADPFVDNIAFDDTLAGGTILLKRSQGQLSITSEITIAGPGADLLTIDAQGNSRIFSVTDSGDAIISGLTVTGGSDTSGGGIFNSADLVIENVVVTGNESDPNNVGGGGGGIHSQNGSLIVRDSIVTGNTFGSYFVLTGGGGINVSSGTALIEGSIISNNTVNPGQTINSTGYGGGVSVLGGGNVTITGSTIAENSGRVFGAGAYSRGTLTILNSTFVDNSTTKSGGGLFESSVTSGVTTVINTTFSGNQANDGAGGVYAGDGVILRNVSVIDNVAGSRGGGIYVGNPQALTMYNTLVAGNTLNDGTVNDVEVRFGEGIVTNSSNNLIAGGDTSLVNIEHGTNGNIIGDGAGNDLDPSTIVEVFLLDNGGPTATHVLVPGSPAIDAGSNAEAVDQDGNPLSFDQRGEDFARVSDGDGDGTATVDIGAVENDEVLRLPMTFVVDNLEDESDGDFSVGDLSFREAVELSNAAVAVDTITFDSTLFTDASQIIGLALGELPITQSVIITGAGADQLTVDAQQASRIFFVSDNVQNGIISGLTLTGGLADQGGAILNQGTLTLNDSMIHGNQATSSGGGIENQGTLSITGSTIHDNTSLGNGGGIATTLNGTSTAVSLTLINSTVSGNHVATNGGGLFNTGSGAVTVTLLNSTILNNTTDGLGGGIYSEDGSSAINMSNTIVANNFASGIASDLGGSTTVSGSNNLIGDADSAGNLTDGNKSNIVGDEGVGTLDLSNVIDTTLADNGGTTLTHALIGGGIAVDTGSNTAASALTFDQLGNTRIFEGDGDGTATVDIGAFEQQVVVYPAFTYIVDTLEDENDGDYSEGDLSLREAIELANSRPAHDIILFDDELAGGTILLDGSFTSPGDDSDFDITFDVTIIGLGADLLTIDAQGNSRIFTVTGDVTDSTITGLTLTGGDGGTQGGAIFNIGTLTIEDSVFHDNQAQIGGAIENFGDLTVIGSTFYDNVATDDGGAIDNFPASFTTPISLTVINSTISGNTAGRDGGGIWKGNFDNISVFNSTITQNSAVRFGGGINLGGTGGDITIHNSIIAGNTVSGVANDLSGAGGLANGNSNIIGAEISSGLTDGVDGNVLGVDAAAVIDPNFQNNGGSTPTHALLDNSIAIDAGDNSLATGQNYDQRGESFYRFSNGTVDVGAFESQQNIIVVDILDDENDGDFSAGDLSLREAIELANATVDADVITFANSLTAGGDATVALTDVEDIEFGPTALLVTTDVTIVGPKGDNGITIAAAGTDDFRLFRVTNSGALALESVNLTGGVAQGGEAADGQGGAIYNQGTVDVRNSTIYGNSAIGGAAGGSGVGGAIYNDDGDVIATNSTFSGNSALGGTSNDANVTSGTGAGGAIYNRIGTVTITGGTLASNVISAGAAAGSQGSALGGAIFSEATDASAFVTLYNTILADSVGGNDFDFVENNSTSITRGEGNLIELNNGFIDTFGSGTNPVVTSDDPNLGPLADNGGPTLTHALSAGSAAVDAGIDLDPDDYEFETLSFDQRYFAGRAVNGAVDIGAYEFGAATIVPNADYVVSTLEDEIDGDVSSGDLSLREAITLSELFDDANVITFDSSLVAGGDATILLSIYDEGIGTGEYGPTAFIITTDVSIVGPDGDNGITLERSGFREFRLFHVTPTGTVTLENLNLTGGVARGGDGGGGGGATGGGGAGVGGAILNEGSVTLTNSTLYNNGAIGGGVSRQGTGAEGGGGGGSTADDGGNNTGDGGGSGGANGGGNGGLGRTRAGNVTGGSGQDGGFGGGGGGGGGIIATGGGNNIKATAGDGGGGGFGGGGGGGGKAFAFNGPQFAGSGGTGGFGAGDGTNGVATESGSNGIGGAGAGLGGAIFNHGGSLTINNSTLSGNTATGGSVASSYYGSSTLYDGNPGSGFGGAIFNRNGNVTISSSTLAGNEVVAGISNNATGEADAGGIYNVGDAGTGTVTLNNAIIADSVGSTSDYIDDAINSGVNSSAGVGNLIEVPNDFSGEVVTTANPNLVALADNGGPTLTHELPSGSSAIDAGNDAAAASLQNDQRGAVRIADGDFDGNAQVDIGALERVVFVNLSVDLNSGSEADQTVITLTATADTIVSSDQTIDVDVSGTGITSDDYSLSNATITILNGQTTGQVTFTIQDDNIVEPSSETATLTLVNPSAAIVLGAVDSQDVQIADNGDMATLTLAAVNATQDEGTGGTTTDFTFSVTLNNAVQGGFDVSFTTDDDTATTADNDYVDNDDSLTFEGNLNESQTITVQVNHDANFEADEVFNVAFDTITNLALGLDPNNITVARSPATGTIVNDDVPLDFGDAPDTYFTLTASGGPSHEIVNDLYLGAASPDADDDGFGDGVEDNLNAASDDDTEGAAPDDEDGVSVALVLIASATSFSVDLTLSNTTGGDANLVGWIDFDNSGAFDPDEAATATVANGATTATLVWNDLGTTGHDVVASDTFARFRLTTDAIDGSNPGGAASDGEIEDHALTVCTTEVTNTNDDGAGSLRGAIACANLHSGSDTITFNIDGTGPHTISPLSPLPAITDSVVIDGTTQPDFAGTPIIELNGSSAGSGANGIMLIDHNGSTIRGLVVNTFDSAAIRIEADSGGHTVSGNYLGLDVDGSTAAGNLFGLHVSSANNMIDRNVISSNNRGILLNGSGATGNMVCANLIGTNAGGNASRGNITDGVKIRGGSGNTIGGPTEADGNTISANFTGVSVFGGFGNNTIQHNLIGTKSTGDGNRGNYVGINLIGTPGTTIRDNVVAGSKRQAIRVTKADTTGTLVEDNLIGLDATGTQPIATTYDGIQISNAPGNTIRGNVIANSGFNGIRLLNPDTSGNIVQGNLIGTALDGTTPMGNLLAGILIKNAPNNQIGGTEPGEGNTISANGEHGIFIERAGATGNVIEGNHVGTDADGTAALGNTSHGIQVADGAGNVIGGTEAGAGNVIAGNLGAGIVVTGGSATIQGNFIGTDANGTLDLGNASDGINVNGGVATIGGAASGAGNVIANNGNNGVKITSGTGNAIRGNSIFNNAALGIDLKPNGPTANDLDDADIGANNLQNWPVINSVLRTGDTLVVAYSLDSDVGNAAFPLTIEFYLSDDGEGRVFLGVDTINSSFHQSLISPADPATVGTSIVATATDADGNTSEFSDPAAVLSPLTASGGVAEKSSTEPLTAQQLSLIVDAAVGRLASVGIPTHLLETVDFKIADLPSDILGLAGGGGSITIDVDAAGYGWFIDTTPADDHEFTLPGGKTQIAPDRMDLLTVVMHELGHIAGLPDLHDSAAEDDLMYGWLKPGVRNTSLEASLADDAFAEF